MFFETKLMTGDQTSREEIFTINKPFLEKRNNKNKNNFMLFYCNNFY